MKLLMFSGGLDSSYLAWKLVQEEEPVHLHHVSIRNRVNPIWKQQLQATQNVLNFIRMQGYVFEFSMSRFDFYEFSTIGYDSDLLLVVAQKVAQNLYKRFNKINLIFGWTPSDIVRSKAIKDRVERKVSLNIWSALIESVKFPNRINNIIQTPLINNNLDKLEILQQLPLELINMTWSCRKPNREGSPCGRCHACKDLEKARKIIKGV